ncbi:hypothetical protein BpHYR1_024333 [Brachionus plicatilis]|uniref:Uncharacterized protein n=1 Tax=Brachionus plicatilis TaxID=10195 RepID=A0A3M7QB57_BRAPC|nr:hypothetical protein BpHYR1_024333 [Brachionus plicatilis]
MYVGDVLRLERTLLPSSQLIPLIAIFLRFHLPVQFNLKKTLFNLNSILKHSLFSVNLYQNFASFTTINSNLEKIRTTFERKNDDLLKILTQIRRTNLAEDMQLQRDIYAVFKWTHT